MPPFYFAEDYHQQYLAKNPWGYCGIGGTGLALPDGDQEAQHCGAERRLPGVRGTAAR